KSSRLTRRQFGILSVTAALAAALPIPGMAQSGATFVLASNTEVDNLDPHVGLGNIPTAFFINVYDSLVRVRGNPATIEPGLASSWDVSADGLEYTFHLAPDATFHDGSPVDAAAVKYSIARLLKIGKGPAWMIADFLSDAGVTVV